MEPADEATRQQTEKIFTKELVVTRQPSQEIMATESQSYENDVTIEFPQFAQASQLDSTKLQFDMFNNQQPITVTLSPSSVQKETFEQSCRPEVSDHFRSESTFQPATSAPQPESVTVQDIPNVTEIAFHTSEVEFDVPIVTEMKETATRGPTITEVFTEHANHQPSGPTNYFVDFPAEVHSVNIVVEERSLVEVFSTEESASLSHDVLVDELSLDTDHERSEMTFEDLLSVQELPDDDSRSVTMDSSIRSDRDAPLHSTVAELFSLDIPHRALVSERSESTVTAIEVESDQPVNEFTTITFTSSDASEAKPDQQSDKCPAEEVTIRQSVETKPGPEDVSLYWSGVTVEEGPATSTESAVTSVRTFQTTEAIQLRELNQPQITLPITEDAAMIKTKPLTARVNEEEARQDMSSVDEEFEILELPEQPISYTQPTLKGTQPLATGVDFADSTQSEVSAIVSGVKELPSSMDEVPTELESFESNAEQLLATDVDMPQRLEAIPGVAVPLFESENMTGETTQVPSQPEQSSIRVEIPEEVLKLLIAENGNEEMTEEELQRLIADRINETATVTEQPIEDLSVTAKQDFKVLSVTVLKDQPEASTDLPQLQFSVRRVIRQELSEQTKSRWKVDCAESFFDFVVDKRQLVVRTARGGYHHPCGDG